MSTLTHAPAPAEAPTPAAPHRAFSAAQIVAALPGAAKKLNPASQWRNPVMFLVWVGAALTTLIALTEPFLGGGDAALPFGFTWGIAIWLWLTVFFANIAESVAEGRGKAQAATLRKTRTTTTARRVVAYSAADPLASGAATEDVPSGDLRVGDVVLVETGELIPGDGDIVAGIATVDESAITGESAPVVRESGGDRSAVTGGTRVLSDRIVVTITSKPGETFVDRMIALVEGASRQRTPNEIALNILLASLSIVFVVVVLVLNPIASYAASPVSIPVLVALLVCLIPTTIGALLSAIGIAGMDRLVQRNVLAMSGRAVEAAGDVTTLLLDKTGTITYGNRRASAFVPLDGVGGPLLAEYASLSSQADPTPEGVSVVELAAAQGIVAEMPRGAEPVPFTAQTRMSGLDLTDGTQVRKGAASAVLAWLAASGSPVPETLRAQLQEETDAIAQSGGTPLVVATLTPAGEGRVLGVIHLKDVVKDGLRERFGELRAMGIRTVMITGDNPLTAKAIAAEAGVDDYLAEATPEDKLALIRREQEGGNLVAMTGDGTNDAPALAQADVGVAMNTGTSAAKEAGNMVDLDSDPTKLIDIVRIGKQLLITRGALTTFSLANDIAKYFAIIPAMFMGVFPGLAVLNVMQLSSPASAVLSAIIFNAIVIVVLIPLALRGVKYRAASASSILSRNLLVYGLGGILVPFIGIKLIDLVVSLLPGF
ncbi:MAG: potassium-transporting ATPase subunit B [Microbacterium sp. 71-36]|uniref:potassium-transporting ATPase subunit KdpB n=2 Tax=Microbacterium TaxID=33882 RepID=UPI00086BEC3B|nr:MULTISPECIES: potassium-transporting ATPase subunit KdpB [unclassified Microbacterium]MBN9212577.1 potassium-transporting ATPase subunit KdpB [Microbacterium sp.]ODT38140.1 MAG: potassium-transporting ATPase subunit B [Microbacterium sp. SCN 71-17]ODU51906.1 MAG: potassium-transporting ATPase subunit B [Microbacterium sp. SCN 70-10]OJV75421.1 MAG: potassium-transporting ATPase subunit B [Microbacterium sp. 71-36]